VCESHIGGNRLGASLTLVGGDRDSPRQYAPVSV